MNISMSFSSVWQETDVGNVAESVLVW